MNILTSHSSLLLWHDLVKAAEERSSITLKEDLESYLISLLARNLDKPQVSNQIFAHAYLEALQAEETQRRQGLQQVGDQCLLFAGLFPKSAERRRVKVVYFVDLGRSAYIAVSKKTNDLFCLLALEFVALMDVLQSIGTRPELLPLEAYEQWSELGSKRSLQILQQYSRAIPFKHSR